MLDSGLSTISYLRSRLLPNAKAGETRWDDALQKAGLSVATRLQNHCGRKFSRMVNEQEQYAARTLSITLRRYPFEAITSILLRDPDGTTAPISTDYQTDAECGIIDFPTPPGSALQRLVVTYTGGFWLDPLDGTAAPENATPLPDDLLEAWIIQIQVQAEALGLFEAVAIRPSQKGEAAGRSGGLTLAPDVVAILRPYRRYSGE